MKRALSFVRTSVLFTAAALFAYALPIGASPQPTQLVDCQLVVTYCPQSMSFNYKCEGDCGAFPPSVECVMKNAGTWLYCDCENPGGGGVPPQFAECSLFFDIVTKNSICGNFGCAGTCQYAPVINAQGCIEVKCKCQ